MQLRKLFRSSKQHAPAELFNWTEFQRKLELDPAAYLQQYSPDEYERQYTAALEHTAKLYPRAPQPDLHEPPEQAFQGFMELKRQFDASDPWLDYLFDPRD
jgi:hypothetical protein